MKLIYKCSYCGQAKEFDYPTQACHDVEFVLTHALHGYVPGVSGGARPWIRHPCQPGVHGIANLVAILEP